MILDADLAAFYGIATRRLNEQVKRNEGRFPGDFMFELNASEKAEVVANCDHLSKLKYSKVLPRALTEHGAIMAASVLKSGERGTAPADCFRGRPAADASVRFQKEIK